LNIKALILFEHDSPLSGDPDVNSVVSNAWNDIGEKLHGISARQIHFLPESNLYRVIHASGEVFL
jgi:hypothetical protein